MSQSGFVEPLTALNRPAMQFVQIVDMMVDAVPASHSEQFLARGALYFPAPQTKHSDDPYPAAFPPGQSEHAVPVPFLEYVPMWHSTQ